MSKSNGEMITCIKCGRTLDDSNFYMSNNLEKYPHGKINVCKKCQTMHVDNWDKETFLPILEDLDVPWVPEEWKSLLDKYGSDPKKMTGTTVLGRYLSKMKLNQWKQYRWKDTDTLAETRKHKLEIQMKAQGYTDEDIEAVDEKIQEDPLRPTIKDEIMVDLTEEDKKYLTLKWGNYYRPYELVQLEQFYTEMENAYDITTPAHKDYLKLICKTSLKCNILINANDIEGFQKMSKVYDSLMKSAKFTAAQDKKENDKPLDSVSELVALAEKQGFIPRFYVDQPNDNVDAVLKDLQNYTHKLITEEMNLGDLIEDALRQMQAQESKDEVDSLDEELELEEMTDDDFINQLDFEEEEKEADAKMMEAISRKEEEDAS
jgi:hypothetical protein